MSDEWEEYKKDHRKVCKYGPLCYQKNPEHHKTYKHPPRTRKELKHTKKRFNPYSKDAKPLETESTNAAVSKIDKKVRQTEAETETVVAPNPKDKAQTNNDYSNVANAEIFNAHVKNDRDQPKETNKPQHEEPNVSIKLPNNLSYHDKTADHKTYKELFLVNMPDDFFKFYECLNDCNMSIEKVLATVSLELIGPYELLLGKLPILDDKELYLINWRFFYDPPEFQAVIKKKGTSQFHIGYYRDEPEEKPVFMASNDTAKGYQITPVAENIFGAVYLYLQNEKSSPFTATTYQKLMTKIKNYADNNGFSVDKYNIKNRLSKVMTRTFHGAGIMFPYNKKTELGYRRLAETDANLKKLFQKLEEAHSSKEKEKTLSEIQQIITYATIAIDECDFGTGLEAGIDLFCSGLKELEHNALSTLSSSYSLLNREPFAKIIKAHLKYRRKGPDMSVIM